MRCKKVHLFGSIPGDLGNVEYSVIAIASSMDQIELFDN